MGITYYKAVQPNGTDFHTGRIDYLAEGEITHPAPSAKGTTDAAGYLSVSIVATDCTGSSWPARLLEVEAVGAVWAPHSDLPNKRAVKALRVVRELDAHLLLGPQGREIAALVERAKTLTYEESRRLDAARDAAWALITRDLIGTEGYTQEHYDLITTPWRKVIGPIHPDDTDLRA